MNTPTAPGQAPAQPPPPGGSPSTGGIDSYTPMLKTMDAASLTQKFLDPADQTPKYALLSALTEVQKKEAAARESANQMALAAGAAQQGQPSIAEELIMAQQQMEEQDRQMADQKAGELGGLSADQIGKLIQAIERRKQEGQALAQAEPDESDSGIATVAGDVDFADGGVVSFERGGPAGDPIERYHQNWREKFLTGQNEWAGYMSQPTDPGVELTGMIQDLEREEAERRRAEIEKALAPPKFVDDEFGPREPRKFDDIDLSKDVKDIIAAGSGGAGGKAGSRSGIKSIGTGDTSAAEKARDAALAKYEADAEALVAGAGPTPEMLAGREGVMAGRKAGEASRGAVIDRRTKDIEARRAEAKELSERGLFSNTDMLMAMAGKSMEGPRQGEAAKSGVMALGDAIGAALPVKQKQDEIARRKEEALRASEEKLDDMTIAKQDYAIANQEYQLALQTQDHRTIQDAKEKLNAARNNVLTARQNEVESQRKMVLGREQINATLQAAAIKAEGKGKGELTEYQRSMIMQRAQKNTDARIKAATPDEQIKMLEDPGYKQQMYHEELQKLMNQVTTFAGIPAYKDPAGSPTPTPAAPAPAGNPGMAPGWSGRIEPTR